MREAGRLRLNGALSSILADAEVRARFLATDITPMGGGASESSPFFWAENDLWRAILRGMGLSAR
jgi:hypothetical protein